MDDFFMEEPTYGEILYNIELVKNEVNNLDQDSLIDEIAGLQHNVIGKEAEKIQHLIFKAYADQTLAEDEIEFLRNMYVVYYCACAIIIDEPEEDDEI